MEIVFDSSDGWLVYFVYLVHKANYEPVSSPRPVRDGLGEPWEPKAGLTLETRCANRIYPECNKVSGLLRVWDEVAEEVGKSLVDSIHHGFPIHSLPEFGFNEAANKAALALYRYEGFFQIEKAGNYIFATSSNWASFLLVDGKLVVSWPGKHDYRGGIRGQKKGKIHLAPGVHKLEYLNCSPWGRMLTLAAWQRPQEKLSLMTRCDFLPVRRYVVTEIGHNEPTKHSDSFKWQIVDDWRLDEKEVALVRLRFDVIKAKPPRLLGEDKSGGNYLYSWKFDDGEIATGESIEHVFLRPGMRTVTLKVLKGHEVLAEVTHIVHAHPLPDKVNFEPGNVQTFEKAISESDFSKVPIGDLVNLYAFAPAASLLPAAPPHGERRGGLRSKTAGALMNRVDELVAESQHQRFCLKLGQYLRSAPIQQHKQALRLFTRLREKSTAGTLVRQLAIACEAELLIQNEGYAKEALEILNQLEQEKNLGKELTYRLGRAKAEALVALGEAERAREILQNLQNSYSNEQKIKHVGMLRHARLLAEHSDDPVQLDYAMEKIEAILVNDPVKLLTPSLNLIRLDIHLARKEYKIAFHLAERLNKLGLSNYYRLEVLARQVKALCGIKAVEQAKAIYEAVAKDYPHSPAVAEARKAIVEAVTADQKQ